jgi:hypothetical protein
VRDLQLVGDEVEEGVEIFRLRAFENRRVRVDAEALGLGRPDRFDRDVVGTGARDRFVVDVLRSIEMDVEAEVIRRRELIEARFEAQRVRAQVDELLPRDQTFDDLFDLRMQQRFAAGNGNHRRAAFVHRFEALLGREMLAQDLDRVLDFSATIAGEVAAEQRLEHEHERIPLLAHEPVAHHVCSHRDCLLKCDCHYLSRKVR